MLKVERIKRYLLNVKYFIRVKLFKKTKSFNNVYTSVQPIKTNKTMNKR